MSSVHSAQDDLAYLRGLVDDAGQAPQMGAALLTAGGLIYGLQCLAYWGELAGLYRIAPPVHLILAIGPTLLFLAILTAVLWRGRGKGAKGAMARASNATASAIGLTNLVLVCIFAPAAMRAGDLAVWLFYPAVVFALQGTIWLIAWMLWRITWMAVVAIGWFVAAIGLGLTIGQPAAYVGIAALALFVLMAGPGLAMMRRFAPR